MNTENSPPANRGLLEVERLYLNMGPQHPSTHGVLRIGLVIEGERIVDAEPDVGYLHRSIEKIAEKRTYLQFIPLTDRLDYVAAMSNNFAYVLAVESLLEIEVPRRAQYIRVIMAELQRIASHLVWMGAFTNDLGAATPLLYGFREREDILDLYEMTCGARLTYNYYRFGGVSRDIPTGFVPGAKKFISGFWKKVDEYEELLTENEIFLKRTKGVGVLSREDAISYAVSGPMLRASGVKWDLRKDRPYSVYPEFAFDVPTGETGDCWDRYKVRIEEMRQSRRILEQALDGIPEGEILPPKLPRTIRPKKGEAYGSVEAPRGELGFYVVSDGGTNPVRLKIRPPCFVNLGSLAAMVHNCLIADLVAILGSIDIVLGEVDR
ncbi:MAG: NADH-quinone oxidoreductase subunit D [Candidatus Eisenbacteria bacterium]|nr:NADH-quinone oxidoreductase subunit D [Candidatus Eisenbacteria bacterium]